MKTSKLDEFNIFMLVRMLRLARLARAVRLMASWPETGTIRQTGLIL